MDKEDKEDKEEMELLKAMMGVMREEELMRVRYRLRKGGWERLVGILDEEIRVREGGGRE